MNEPKPKKATRSRKASMKAGASPMPMCGHEGGTCGPSGCQVRYVGPVSHMRDHYAWHAARGSTHIWAAAVTTGLALVLTGAIAWQSVEAKQSDREAALRKQYASRADVERLMQKLNEVEKAVNETRDMIRKQAIQPSTEEVMDSTMPKVEE